MEIKKIDLGCPHRNEDIKYMSVQPQIGLCNNSIKLNESANFVKSILDVAKNENVDLLVFPEYSIPSDMHSLFLEWSEHNNCVVIAGTDIVENYNTSTTFCKGKKYETRKIYLSPLEKPREIVAGDTIYEFINTPIGSFVILICNDLNSSEVQDSIKTICPYIDFLIVLASHDKTDEHYAFINVFVHSSKNTKNPIYAIYCNSFQGSDKGGESAFFANDYEEVIEEAKKSNDIPKESKLASLRFLLKNDFKYYIAKCKLDKVLTVRNTNPDRAKFSILYKGVISNNINDERSDSLDDLLQELKKLVDEDIKDRSHDFKKFNFSPYKYSELFSFFIECDMLDNDKINNIFETTYEIITKEEKEDNAFPIKITGNSGTGKSKFLSILFQYLFNKIEINDFKYIPFYLGLHSYAEMKESESRIEIENAFKIIFAICKELPNSYIILMIDSVEDHKHYEPFLLPLIVENLDKIKNQKRLVCIGDLASEDIATVPRSLKDKSDVEFRFTTIKPYNYEEVVNIYSQIYEMDSNNFMSIINKNRIINEIDFCLLTFIRNYLLVNNDVDISLADVCFYYCKEKLINNTKIFEKAEMAFKYFDKTSDSDLSYDDWRFINKSIIFKNYLLAYYYSQYLLKPELWNDELVFKTSFGSRVTHFIKSIICTGVFSEEEKYFNAIKDFFSKFQNSYSAKKLLCYLMGRFKTGQIKKDAVDFLKGQKHVITNLIRQEKKEDTHRALELLLRTIYISLIYLNQKNENDEYINLLLDDINKNEYNMRFHLQYYGNIKHEVIDLKTPDEENQRAFYQTFISLEKKVKEHLEGKEDPLFEVDLLTICSIIQIGSQNDKLLIEYADKSKDIISSVLKSSRIENEKLRIFLEMIEKYLKMEGGFKNNYLFDWADKLNSVERTGWKNDGIPNPENVVGHTYSCWLIGFLYLPTKAPTNEKKYRGYCKSDILNMLLIHDLAEVETGDIVKGKKTEEDRLKENHIMQKFFMHDTYNLNICGVSVNYTHYKKLWENFFKKKNINGEIASDIDAIQARYKYIMLKEKNKFTPEREREWEQELELNTDIGREIWKILELHKASKTQ